MSRNPPTPSNTSYWTSGAGGDPAADPSTYARELAFADAPPGSNTNSSQPAQNTYNPPSQYDINNRGVNSASGGNSASNATSGQSYPMASYQEQRPSQEPYHGFPNVSSDPRGGAGVSGSATGVNQSGGQGGGYGGGDSRQGNHGYQNGNEDARSRDATWGSRSSAGGQR